MAETDAHEAIRMLRRMIGAGWSVTLRPFVAPHVRILVKRAGEEMVTDAPNESAALVKMGRALSLEDA